MSTLHNQTLINDIALLDAIRDRILIELYLALEDIAQQEVQQELHREAKE